MSADRDDMPRDEAISDLYKAGAKAEPPAELDALILAAARREAAAPVSRPAERCPRPWWRNWLAPAGAIATVLLALSVTLNIEREQPDVLPAAAPLPRPEVAESKSPSSFDQAEPAAKAMALSRDRVMQSGPPLSPPAAMPMESLPVPSPSTDEFAEGGHSARARMLPPSAAASRNATAGAPPAKEFVESAKASGNVATKQRYDALRSVTLPPERWLNEIRRLKAAGLHDQASEQLKSFRRTYPDIELPNDLRPEP